MTARTQPIPKPATPQEQAELIDHGVLIDMAGRPLARRHCPYCDGATVGDTCPYGVDCPTCYAAPGSGCRRPSEHQTGIHDARIHAAQEIDAKREAAGDLTLPARWPAATAARAKPVATQLTLFGTETAA